MKTGLKVWLWIIFVLKIIVATFGVFSILGSPLSGILTVACAVVFAIGVGIMLFKQQKLGFYLLCGSQAVMLVGDIVVGANIVIAIIGALVLPLITWLLLKGDWDSFK